MPELPEVETVRGGLAASRVGRTIVGVRIQVPKMLKGSLNTPELFSQAIQGGKLESVRRSGKHLILSLSSGYHLLLHLNMRGSIRVMDEALPDGKYLAFALNCDDGRDIRFYDIWRWGEASLITDRELSAHPALSTMGIEPLSPLFTPEALHVVLQRRRRTSIKAVLLDQHIVAGIGNIYADESLFRSGIRPERATGTLNFEETGRLREALFAVLTEAVDCGGTTSDNYVDPDGSVGRYTPRVYDRRGKPCVQCGSILERTKIVGRGTVYCPNCQV